jgi:hypothetical protein
MLAYLHGFDMTSGQDATTLLRSVDHSTLMPASRARRAFLTNSALM